MRQSHRLFPWLSPLARPSSNADPNRSTFVWRCAAAISQAAGLLSSSGTSRIARYLHSEYSCTSEEGGKYCGVALYVGRRVAVIMALCSCTPVLLCSVPCVRRDQKREEPMGRRSGRVLHRSYPSVSSEGPSRGSWVWAAVAAMMMLMMTARFYACTTSLLPNCAGAR